MPKTAQEIFAMAYATSSLNDADAIAEESGELLSLLNELLATYIEEGARVNPEFFGERTEVDFVALSNGWPRPAGTSTVLRLEAGDNLMTSAPAAIAEGSEVIELPFDQRDAEPGRPAVYQLGQVWYPAGRASDPASGTLVVIAGAGAPDELTDVGNTLPVLWPEVVGNPVLKWELAIFLAQKDGERDNEVTAFERQLERAVKRYYRFLETASVNQVRDYAHHRPYTSPGVTTR